MRVIIRVIPRARQNKVTVEGDGSLRVHTTAVPADGEDNDAVKKMLAEHFKVPKTSIKIIRGTNTRDKIVEF